MLKSLELFGFKSFAERTRFDFAPGVTAIVGPNGSGKSNVVDAVRWLLGEQSARALRGGEATDVIFNGSAARKSLGLAEVSMTFDNAARTLDTDLTEVRVTRRVYRDGTGEYAINGREARLKDVRALFAGSGAGHGAYSVIEQGRVDALLTASTRDRRAILDEAAGVGRFKLRKAETLKKLGELERDLARLRDLAGELDGQVRAARLQAARADRHRVVSAELRAIRRAQLAAEGRELAGAEGEARRAADSLRAEVAALAESAASDESRLAELDRTAADAEGGRRAARDLESRHREAMALAQVRLRAECERLARAEAEATEAGAVRLRAALRRRALAAEAGRAAEKLAFLSARFSAESERSAGAAATAEAAATADGEARRALEAARAAQVAADARAAKLATGAESRRADADRLAHEIAAKTGDIEQARRDRQSLTQLLDELARADADLSSHAEAARVALAGAAARRAEFAARADALRPGLERRREERGALAGRLDALAALDRGGEGAGARALLARLGPDPESAGAVVGLVADLIRAPLEIAPLVDLALGGAGECLLVRDAALLPGLLRGLGDLPGRVGFVALSPQPPPTWAGAPAGAVCLADLVTSPVPGLAAQLLGSAYLVESPPERCVPGVTLVTRAGEVWDARGRVAAGPPPRPDAGGAPVARRSELAALALRLEASAAHLAELEREQAELRGRATGADGEARAAEADLARIAAEAGELRGRLGGERRAARQLGDSVARLESELAGLAAQLGEADAGAGRALAEAEVAGSDARAAAERVAEALAEAESAGRARDAAAQRAAAAALTLARVEEQRATEAAALAQAEEYLADAAAQFDQSLQRLRARQLLAREAQLGALRCGAALAAAARLRDESAAARRHADSAGGADPAGRDELRASLRAGLAALHRKRERLHQVELELRDLAGRRAALAEKLAEAGGGDDAPPELPPMTAAEAEARADELRAALAKLGAVNPGAAAELAALEARADSARAQRADLARGQAQLLEVVAEADRESRARFEATLAEVRGHFQELFRQLFGGGRADIVLEDDADVLESGIEVVAHPPGKQAQRLSLLSGGERALVAVALLLAVFRARPSPFCLLDEIDAAMDEANATRLADRLAEFGERSQFVVITHKKRTMARAQVLVGVTMRESGVSAVVPVRFEDWPDEAPVEAEKRAA